ncbi:MAG: ABC transporter permease [Erysipelotrichia bacterium]|nr:ABC transporter permease [Erysipelotrichia bacterium]
MGNDSYIVFELDDNILESNYTYLNKINFVIKSVLLIIVNLFVFVIYNKRKSIFSVTKEIYDNKDLVWSLSKNDFKTKYAGSYLGIFWAFVNPIVTILIYWFVFEFGLKAGAPIPNVPFILWFTSGLIPWFFFSDAVINATNSFIEYSYLVKKVVFKISILPVVKIISSMFIHLVFVVFIISIFAIYGKLPNLYMIQIIYYSFCIFILSLAISYATSALIIFFKDLSQIIGILLQVGMWMTPIMWSYTMIPQNLQWIFKLNPMFYIVEGYRDTLINNELFYNNFWGTLYFWTITAFIFITGMIIFRKMKPHFSDVL